jgi:hypothetical protein
LHPTVLPTASLDWGRPTVAGKVVRTGKTSWISRFRQQDTRHNGANAWHFEQTCRAAS